MKFWFFFFKFIQKIDWLYWSMFCLYQCLYEMLKGQSHEMNIWQLEKIEYSLRREQWGLFSKQNKIKRQFYSFKQTYYSQTNFKKVYPSHEAVPSLAEFGNHISSLLILYFVIFRRRTTTIWPRSSPGLHRTIRVKTAPLSGLSSALAPPHPTIPNHPLLTYIGRVSTC